MVGEVGHVDVGWPGNLHLAHTVFEAAVDDLEGALCEVPDVPLPCAVPEVPGLAAPDPMTLALTASR